MRLLAALAMIGIGCTTDALPGGSDGGPDNDGSVAADLGSLSCGDIASSVAEWLAAHTSCTVDDDCVIVTTGCGLPRPCGDYVNRGAPGAYLSSLLAAWQHQCDPGDCACPASWPAAGCNEGTCGVRMPHVGPLGAPCTSDVQCAPGLLCAGGPAFPGGYCTQEHCDSAFAPCPTGYDCKPVGDAFYCLKDCAAADPGACRDGYRCCSGKPLGAPDGWCAPDTSLLCSIK